MEHNFRFTNNTFHIHSSWFCFYEQDESRQFEITLLYI